MNYCYKVELLRRVAAPEYGVIAYSSETKEVEFPFGKGKEFKTGKEAKAAAELFANQNIDDASSVSVWRIAGGGGTGYYIKDDLDSRFAIGWNIAE